MFGFHHPINVRPTETERVGEAHPGLTQLGRIAGTSRGSVEQPTDNSMDGHLATRS
jgi:hypothetical protein